MRRWQSLLARLSAVAMLASLLALVGNSPAQADAVPTTNWTPVTIGSDLPAAGTVLTDAAGGVTVGCPTGNSPTHVFKSFSSTGSVVQNQSVGNPIGTFCTGNATVGKDSTVYVGAMSSNGMTQYIQAWKNNSLVWQYQIPCGSNGVPWTMTMGANGNLYVTIWQGSSPCNNGMQLIGLTPTAQTGSNPPVPQVVVNMSLWTSIRGGGAAAYDDGLVFYTNSNSILYVPYSTTSAANLADPIAVSNVVNSWSGGRWFEAQPDGTVYLPIRSTTAQSLGCSDPNSRTGSILAVKPNDTTSSSSLGGCTTMHEIHPMPGGGAVLRYAYSATAGVPEVEKVSAGSWSRDIGEPDALTNVVTTADLNGNVALRFNLAPWFTVGGSSYRFPQISFRLLSGATGADIAQFFLRGEHDTTNGPSYMWGGDGDIALAKNTVYVTARECTTMNYCQNSTTKLYAFTVPGLQMDYPRGAILKHDEPWKDYVALGDSFSAGQGVPPFSDTSGCNRSTKAYPNLLAQSVAHRLTLQSFIACSGATTQDVLLGGVTGTNQPKQVNALGTGTDVVTISIGGNDIGFGPLAEKCVTDLHCEASSELTNAVYKLTNVLPGALDDVYDAIESRVGTNTRVLVVGYPMMMPDPAINTLPNCPYLQYDEKVAARSVISQLNQAVEDAVDRAGSKFEYVDPNTTGSPFIGHELCMDGGYYTGVDVGHPEYSLHPNVNGQDAYGRVIGAYLD